MTDTTRRQIENRHAERSLRALNILGNRSIGYKADTLDFQVYLAELNKSLLQTSRGRLFLCAGGLLWRLASTVVDPGDAAMGPTEGVYDDGHCLWDGTSQHAYWHEALTPGEIDLACGVYRVQAAQADQMSHLSWWPRPNLFFGGGLYPGWWSPRCETWYRGIQSVALGEVDGRPPQLVPVQAWKGKFHFDKKLRPFLQQHEEFMDHFLMTCTQCLNTPNLNRLV
ncbi:hypothetical protein C8F01DRAFT_1001502 [Mycena amicta]|nr:hypothetical protein C8F01DRAFT_1001502 [Mycena amicta]